MTKEEMQAIREMMKEVVSEELQGLQTEVQTEFKAVHKKLDHLQFQMDTVYHWVDRVDTDVSRLKKAK